ncbi:hypothetical protein [Variovorax ginsengisoli]|uniref:Flagellar assembly protein T N-terminal domain-containing protein n=1 Tax=Variovorax ginsengisoli TaxID=363844 RepID=A0ABT9SEE1_9BURK|nr:hypothetical protein [Variovorax ginsengisoli]MDP9902148.1 hypothetical protein [Variovorax ginsengisoli]
MQIARSLMAVFLACFAVASVAQVQQARGKASVTYQGRSVSADDKAKATQAAQLKAIDFYYAEAGESESENFDVVREKILANPDRYILESTVLGEEDTPDKRQYTVAVRVSLNVANLRNLVKSNSAVAKAGAAEKSQLVFVFVSREVASVKSFDDRVYKRVDQNVSVNARGVSTAKGTEGESIRGNQISTNESTSATADFSANRSRSIETGGSTVTRASEATYRLYPSANLNVVFTGMFARAGFEVIEAGMAEPATGGRFSVAKVEEDYQTGNDLKSATLQSIAAGMRTAGVPYVALGTLDVAPAGKDPVTGLVRVGVTVNAKVYNVSKAIPSTQAAVGPVQYAGVGPDESTARGSALTQAANNAARELTSQLTAKGIQ